MGKKTQTFDGSKYSAWQVLEAANAYYALSRVFTSKLPRTMIEVEQSMPSMDEAVASATNRILALELYLKALLIGADQTVPKEHDLKILFDALHKDTRQTIKHHFDERNQLDSGREVSWQLTMYFQLTLLTDYGEFREQKESVITDPSLSALLVRNRHGFVVSRYLFQEAKHDKVSTYDYEYRRLAMLCSVLCEALESSLPNRFAHYQRTFTF